MIANNRGGIAKRLWSELGDGEPIQVRELEDEHAEARFVVGEIERLVDEGASRAEIAVFYRTNAMSRVLEDTLVRREIAYQVIGGTKFYERAEIKDAIAYLSLLANPLDVVSFTRVANSPRRGLGQTSLGRIVAHSAHRSTSRCGTPRPRPMQIPGLGAAAVKALRRFMDTMDELRDSAWSRACRSASCWRRCSRRPATSRRSRRSGRSRRRGASRTSRSWSRSAASSTPPPSAGRGHARRVPRADRARRRRRLPQRRDEGLVTLMTLHNAKGLEYPIVFIVGCEDGVFPHSRALDEGGLEEERRLFYVGMTRAMRSLYLTYARRRAVFGAQTYGLRSRFLDEIPDELTDREDAAPARAQRRARRRDRPAVGRRRAYLRLGVRRRRGSRRAGAAPPRRAALPAQPRTSAAAQSRSGSARMSPTPPSARASSPAWSPTG